MTDQEISDFYYNTLKAALPDDVVTIHSAPIVITISLRGIWMLLWGGELTFPFELKDGQFVNANGVNIKLFRH